MYTDGHEETLKYEALPFLGIWNDGAGRKLSEDMRITCNNKHRKGIKETMEEDF
jgi:hypothetical protein